MLSRSPPPPLLALDLARFIFMGRAARRGAGAGRGGEQGQGLGLGTTPAEKYRTTRANLRLARVRRIAHASLTRSNTVDKRNESTPKAKLVARESWRLAAAGRTWRTWRRSGWRGAGGVRGDERGVRSGARALAAWRGCGRSSRDAAGLKMRPVAAPLGRTPPAQQRVAHPRMARPARARRYLHRGQRLAGEHARLSQQRRRRTHILLQVAATGCSRGAHAAVGARACEQRVADRHELVALRAGRRAAVRAARS